MHMAADTLYNAGWSDDPSQGGIPRTRLAWLCQPEQIERLAMLIKDDEYLTVDEEETGLAALNLFARIVHRLASRADIEMLDVEGTKAFLQEQLAALITQARATRQPIPDGELEALCIEQVGRETAANIVSSSGGPSPRQRAGSIRLGTSCTNWESTSLPFAPTDLLRNRNMSRGWRGHTPTGMTMTRKRAGIIKAARSCLGAQVTGTREGELQARALCVEALWSQTRCCASGTGGNVTTIRT
jgi:hypothetical protein